MEKSAAIFRFKRFSVVNERSAMKVNTDGVLLGALMTILPEDRYLLDIGTGTGTIALMAAQRLIHPCPEGAWPEKESHCNRQNAAVHIDAIDIDEPSATEAALNFRNSPWTDVLHAHHTSLEDFSVRIMEQSACHEADRSIDNHGYDLIFSNPPYFDCSLQAPEERRNAARHTSTGLSYREILNFASEHIAVHGRVALVLPADTEHDLTRHARMCGLHLHSITRIRTVPRKAPSRIVAEFSRQRPDIQKDTVLTIQNEGQYTLEYLELMREFYLFA